MRRKAILLILVIALLAIGMAGCVAEVGSTGPVEWYNDWSEALKQAQAQNKPILINFYTDVCPACRQLDRETYTDEELSGFLNDNFINLRSNAGRSTLYKRYGIGAVPTIIFNTPDGFDSQYEISRFVGFRTVEDFSQEAQLALEKWRS